MKYKGFRTIIIVVFSIALLCLQSTDSAAATYTYDSLSRLISVDYGNGTTIDYTYDAAGNRLALTALTDADGDGLADSWETTYFGDLTTASDTTDYDTDTYSDLTEYQNGTDPKNYLSAPGPITVYVDDGNTSGIYHGSPALPFNDIQGAIIAARSGDTLQVLSGNYTGPIVVSKDNLAIYGEGAVLTVSDAANSGAAFDITGRSNIHIEGFTLQNGQSNFGGGINIANSSNVTIKSNLLVGNSANTSGGGIAVTGTSSSVTIQNNVIDNNTATTSGGGIYIDTTGTGIDILNNTIVSNTSPNSGIHVANGTPVIRNVILWNNPGGDLFGVTSAMIHYSLIGDGAYNGVNNNITGDPLFKLNDPYYHLVSCSPAVDTGDPVDLYNQESAPNGSRINMGAYGNSLEAATTPQNIDTDLDGVIDACDNCTEVANIDQRDTNNDRYGNMCDPDLNNDGFCTTADFGLWLGVFRGGTPPTGVTVDDLDLNGDGQVTTADFGIWLNCFRTTQIPGPSGYLP